MVRHRCELSLDYGLRENVYARHFRPALDESILNLSTTNHMKSRLSKYLVTNASASVSLFKKHADARREEYQSLGEQLLVSCFRTILRVRFIRSSSYRCTNLVGCIHAAKKIHCD